MGAAFVAEVVLTDFFLIIILGATGKKAPAGFAPIAIGLALIKCREEPLGCREFKRKPKENCAVLKARSTFPARNSLTSPLSRIADAICQVRSSTSGCDIQFTAAGTRRAK